MRPFRLLLAAALAACLLGCAPNISHYQNQQPRFDLRQYFSGKVRAWGMVQDYRGVVTRQFTVDIDCTWQGDTSTLDEQFVFADGEKQFRRWTLTRLDDFHYRGRADDVIGEATGEVAGNALRWSYVLRVPVDDSTYDITFDDWMFLQDERHLFNKARMSKFGITVGEITLFFQK